MKSSYVSLLKVADYMDKYIDDYIDKMFPEFSQEVRKQEGKIY